MPALVAWLVEALGASLVTWAVQLIASFGLSIVTYEFAAQPIKAYLISQTSGLTPQMAGLLGYMKVDVAMTMILSAYVVGGFSKVALRRRR
jgi:hypothetical protein